MKTVLEIKDEIKKSLNKTGSGSISKEDIFGSMLDILEVVDSEFNHLKTVNLLGGVEYVDLGLPSGNLWMSYNLGSSNELEVGQYFSWGSVDGFRDASKYKFSKASYDITPESKIQSNLKFSNDPIKVNLGHEWRLPSSEDFLELTSNTIISFVKFNGVSGIKLVASNGRYLFFPTSGFIDTGTLYGSESKVFLWTSDIIEKSECATQVSFSDGTCNLTATGRYVGMNVRGVINKINIE